jgi:DNA-binding NarL/FixJ family response regulator
VTSTDTTPLPACFARPADEPNESRSGPEWKEARDHERQPAGILVVEDDFLIAMQMEATLRDAGFNVVGTAATADEAISLARETRPSLAVMDIRLASERDGIDAARQLFSEFNIRCIFATAHDDVHTHERAAPFAPLGWLAKPYTPASLVALVAKALSIMRLSRQ